MKRVGGLFEQVYDINNLVLAHNNARKSKTFYTEVKMVDANPGKYLYELQDAIKNHTYRTSEYEVFKKFDGTKEREIFKLPYYPDRVFQWAVIQVIEPYILRNLTDDTYSALPKRGTYKAYKKVKKALRTDVKGTQWCLKIDISKYYPSIDKQILKDKYARMFKDKDLLELLYEVIDSTDGPTGVPIGNYFSQYSGNLYLSDFDHKVKEEYKVKHYFRYMDDMVFFGSTKEELHALIAKIIPYMENALHLSVKKNWSVFRVDDRGVDFVGYVFKHSGIRLRKGIAKTLKRVSMKIKQRVNKGMLINYHLYCAINSMCGWLKHCDSGGLKLKYVDVIWEHVVAYHDTVIVNNRRRLQACSC